MRSMFLTTFAALTLIPSAQAADLLPLGALDPQTTAGVLTADPLRDGEMRGAWNLAARQQVSSVEALRHDAASQHGDLRDANVISALFGYGISPVLGLALGMHASYEHLPAPARDALFADEARFDAPAWRGSLRQTRASGASFLLKLNLLKSQQSSVAIAPFLESGIGEAASYSLTRSIGPKAGVMALASYGAKGSARLHLNLGWRHRDPETLAKHTLRQEVFYKAMTEGFLSKTFSLFAATEGRAWRIDASPKSEQARTLHGSSLNGGFKAYLGDAELSAYAGQSLGRASGIGIGKRSYGLSLAFALGGASPKTRYATEIQQAEARQAARQAAPKAKSFVDEVEAVFPSQGDYQEMSSEPTEDFLENASQGIVDADFVSSAEEAQRNRIPEGELSEDEKVQQELSAIREAELAADRKRELQEAAEEKRMQKARAKQAQEEEKLMNEWLREAQNGVDAEFGADASDADWQGLED